MAPFARRISASWSFLVAGAIAFLRVTENGAFFIAIAALFFRWQPYLNYKAFDPG